MSLSLRSRLHRDECGAVSLETVLVIGAITLPTLIFVLKFGWPKVREFFNEGLNSLESASDKAANGQ